MVVAVPVWAATTAANMQVVVTSPNSATIGSSGSVGTSDFQRLIQNRTYKPDVSPHTGTSVFEDLLKRPWGGPKDLSDSVGKVVQKVEWGNVAKAFAKAMPWVVAANTASQFFQDMAGVFGCTWVIDVGFKCDPGEGEQPIGCYRYNAQSGQSSVCYKTHGQMVQAAWVFWQATYSGTVQIDVCYARTVTWIGRDGTVFRWRTVQFYTCGGIPPAPVTQEGEYGLSWSGGDTGVGCQWGDKRPDGQCPRAPLGDFSKHDTPATEETIAEKQERWGDKTKASDIQREAEKVGITPEVSGVPKVEQLPSTIPVGRDTTHLPDGSTQVRDRSIDITPEPDVVDQPTRWTWRERETTNTYPPGVQPPPQGSSTQPPGTVPGGSTTTTPTEFKGCGLPGTPPCKIDETGTPSAQTADQSKLQQHETTLKGKLGEIEGKAAPEWSWTFALPTSCSAFSMGAGYALLGLPTVDVCQWQSIIHDLMSMVWVIATVWGCITMVGRTIQTGS